MTPEPVRARAGIGSTALTLGASLLAMAVVAWRLPLPPDDAFRGTLVLLPLILAGLREIHRWGVRLGGRPLSAPGNAVELGALALLIPLIVGRSHLSLGNEAVLAAGLLMVLGSRVARQTVALRPLLGDTIPGRPSALFFLLPLTVYLAILPWSAGHRQPDGDEPFYLLVTHSLSYDLDADLTNNYADQDWRFFMNRPIEPQPGDPVGPGGEKYSRHNEMLPMALVPAYRLGGKPGALATMATLTALLAWMTLRLARRYFPDLPGEALLAWALAAFTPPLLLYSYQVWVEVPAAILVTAALDRILSLDRQGRWGRKEWLSLGLPVLLLPLVKIRFILIAGPLLVLGWWHAGRPRKPLILLAGMLGAVAGGILLYNKILYRNPLKIHTWQEVDPQQYGALSYVKGLLGLFYDGAFGLFGCSPIWLVLVPALLLLAVRRHRLLLHLAALSLPYLVVVAPRIEWYGGWSPPFRYALIALPLLAVALVPLFVPLLSGRQGRPGAWGLLGALGAVTVVLTLLWVTVPGWTYNFADGRTYALDALSTRLGLDVTRFFPSTIRLRTATWAWPLLSIPIVTALWWLPGRSKRVQGGALLLGAGLCLGSGALLLRAADHFPTETVELEDPYAVKSGGHLHPDRWVVERTRYRGGWVLRVGERLTVPVVAGGRRVRLRLEAEFIRNQPVPYTLDLMAGDRMLASWTPGRQRVWETVEVGPVDWHAGDDLVLVAHGPAPPGALNGAILDRLRLEWQ